jgi:ADP-ribosylglycohydrolase
MNARALGSSNPPATVREGSGESLALLDRFRGLLLGTAVGDALGLPAEGLSPRRARRLFGGSWCHRFAFGRGMVSDDTEHAFFVAQSLIAHPDSADAFARRLAWCLRAWLLSLPAGLGFGTLRATCKLWLGWPVRSSGVRSAGNGPAMRVAPIGAFFAHAPERLDAYVRASSALTHRDPRATTGAAVVARLAAWCVREGLSERPGVERFVEVLRVTGDDDEWNSIVTDVERAAREDLPVPELARRLGLGDGVTGYVHHTVAVCAYAWLRHGGDFRSSLVSVLD